MTSNILIPRSNTPMVRFQVTVRGVPVNMTGYTGYWTVTDAENPTNSDGVVFRKVHTFAQPDDGIWEQRLALADTANADAEIPYYYDFSIQNAAGDIIGTIATGGFRISQNYNRDWTGQSNGDDSQATVPEQLIVVSVDMDALDGSLITNNVTVLAGFRGEPGAPGAGIPDGGTPGQVLMVSDGGPTHLEYETLTKANIQGIENVDNTSDANKPISTATQTALNGKLNTGVTTADIPDSSNRRYVTDAQRTVLQSTSGTNTGDQDLSGFVPSSRTINGRPLTSDISGLAEQSAVDAVTESLILKQVRNWPSVGPAGSGANYECNGTNDGSQFEAIADYCVAHGFKGFQVLDGHYFLDRVIRIRQSPFYIVGCNPEGVTISPVVGFGVSKTDITADSWFTFYDYNVVTDVPLNNITVMNIVFDYMNRVPDSSLRSPSAIRYRPIKGNTTTDRVTTSGITANASVLTVPSGYDVLYGWLENSTTNPTRVAVTTTQPQVSTAGLAYGTVAATSFNNVSSNQVSPTGQLPAGTSLAPPNVITANDTYLGLISAYFTLTSLVLTNTKASPVTFKLQTKPWSVTTNNSGDYTDITAEITIAANSSYTVTSSDLVGGVLPSSTDQLIRIDQGGSSWSSVNIAVGAKVLTPTLPGHITLSGTSLGVVLQDWDITKLILTNNTASNTTAKLQVRVYSASGRDINYVADRNWLDLTSEFTVPANGSLTVKRSSFVNALPTNSNTDLRIVQGTTPWSGVDLTLTSVEQIHAIYDFYREITVPGEQTVSQSGFTADAVFSTPLTAGMYVKSITFTETAGHDWNGFLTDDSIAVLDRISVPANTSVTVSTNGNSAKANAIISGGSLTGATITNGGTNYDAAPLVQVQGDGTGATATATVSAGGAVTGITITNGGTGYTQATITIVSLQRYNYFNPLPYTQTMKVRAQQPPSTAPQNAKIWNDASVDISITLGVRIGIRKEFMNRIFPQSTSRTLYVVNTDNDFNGAALKTTFQLGVVVKNFHLENVRVTGFPNTGFGAIEVLAGKALGSSNLAICQSENWLFKNLVFENSYYPVQNSTTRMMQMHFTSTFVRDVVFDNVRFEDTHGSQILWSGDAGDSLPIVVVRARQYITAKDLQFFRTKKGVFNGGSRLEDWGDETRIGFHHLTFERPVIEEGTDGWFSDFGYETEGASDPWSIVSNSQTRSCLNFMNSRDVVINYPRVINARTIFDYGYTNPPGNESQDVRINHMYLDNCYELGDLDGAKVTYTGGKVVKLRATGKINNYGNHNPTIFRDVEFEDPGVQIQPGLPDRCLFQVHDGGMQFIGCLINLTVAQNVDYIFQEQNSNASATLPVRYMSNIFMGVTPNKRTFGLNSALYHRIIGNEGVKEDTIQAVFSSTRTEITPTAYLGVGYGNVKTDGTIIDPIPDSDKVTLSTTQTIAGTKTFTNSPTVAKPAATSELIINADTSQIAQVRFRKNAVDDWFMRSTAGGDMVIGDAVGPFNALVIYKATHMTELGQGFHLKRISDMTGTPNGIYSFVDTNGNPKWKLSNSTPAAKFITWITTSITADRSITIPDASTTLVGRDTTDTLTGKTMSGSSNTFSNIPESAVTNLVTDLAGKLAVASNLSDLANAGTARANLGLGTTATLNIDTDATLAANSNSLVSSQAAIKSYVDNNLTGLTWKASVRAATTAAITLSGTQTIDGVAVVAGDRVLVKNQSTASQNGLYVVAAGAWSRSTDADTGTELVSATTLVREGTAAADTQWTCTADNINLGTTSVTFAQISGAGTYSADNTTLQLTGNQFSIKDVELLALSGLTSAADQLPYFTGAGTANTSTFTSFMRTLLDDADAGTARTTLGAVGLAGSETIAGTKTFSSSPVVPTPTNTNDTANKAYVDSAAATAAAVVQAGSDLIDSYRKRPFLYNDFMVASGTSQMDPFTATLVASGTINTPTLNADPVHPGVTRLRSSTTTNSGVYIGTNSQQILLGGGEICEFVFRLETLALTTTRIGFHDTANEQDAVDGAYIEIDSSGIATGKTSSNSTRSTTATSLNALSASTWYRAKVVVNSTVLVTFTIYNMSGTALWSDTLTTNIPTAAGRSTGMGLVVTNSGTTVADLMNLDYMALTYSSDRTR